MPIPRRFPFAGRNIMNLKSDLDRIYDEFFGGEEERGTFGSWIPAVNIEDSEEALLVYVDLPGVEKEDVKITFQDKTLNISGKKQEPKKKENVDVVRSERVFGTFNRSFQIPDSIQSDKIEANFTNGVLIVTLPKAEESKTREIKVNIK